MKKYDVIGLMSGTSLDGLDIVFVRFSYNFEWSYKVIQCQSVSYDIELSNKLKHAAKVSGIELKKLDVYYGKWIGNQVKTFMDVHKLKPQLIVSHGHTIFHQPEIGLTLQIGDGYQIMLTTGVKTVCDLRSLDISFGGQGAPLVPIGDKLLFKEYDACLNLGGFSNISFDKDGKRIAYDICPVNIVLNELASRMNLPYDKDGETARVGKCNKRLLQKLNALQYYGQKPPKSLGLEWVQHHIFPILKNDTTENLLNTFCDHITYQITSSIEDNFQFSTSVSAKMLVTGGGTKNSFLMDLLKTKSGGKWDIIIPDNQIIEFKEAIIFAFLGLLRILGKINSLKSVTGSISDSSGGLIYDHLSSINPT